MFINRYGLVILSLTLILFIFGIRPAAACSPPPPDWWFVEEFTIEPAHAPPDIVISSAVQPSETVRTFTGPKAGQVTPGGEARGHLNINNQSAAPFYLTAPKSTGAKPVEQLPVPLPKEIAPVFKLEPNESVALAIQAVLMLDPGLTDYNKAGYDRPAEAAPPAPQQVKLSVVYNDRVQTLPLLLTYGLNPNFTPKTFSGCIGSFQGIWLTLLAGLGIGLVVAGGITYFAWKKLWSNYSR